MKYVFVFLLVGLSFNSFGQNRYHIDETTTYTPQIDPTTINEDPTTTILKSTNKAVTGVVYSKYDNGQLEEEISFIAGIKNGPWRAWWRNGQLRTEGNFKYNKLSGLLRAWHENGQLEYKGKFKEYEAIGTHRSWHENGQLEYIGKIKEDKAKKGSSWTWDASKKRSEKCWDKDGNKIKCPEKKQ